MNENTSKIVRDKSSSDNVFIGKQRNKTVSFPDFFLTYRILRRMCSTHYATTFRITTVGIHKCVMITTRCESSSNRVHFQSRECILGVNHNLQYLGIKSVVGTVLYCYGTARLEI